LKFEFFLMLFNFNFQPSPCIVLELSISLWFSWVFILLIALFGVLGFWFLTPSVLEVSFLVLVFVLLLKLNVKSHLPLRTTFSKSPWKIEYVNEKIKNCQMFA
jgi:hypothetical protein